MKQKYEVRTMKIAEGMFYHEANSFNPSMVRKEDLVYE